MTSDFHDDYSEILIGYPILRFHFIDTGTFGTEIAGSEQDNWHKFKSSYDIKITGKSSHTTPFVKFSNLATECDEKTVHSAIPQGQKASSGKMVSLKVYLQLYVCLFFSYK